MTEAIEQQTDIEQTREVLRATRALEEAVTDAQDDLLAYQQTFPQLMAELQNPDNASAEAKFGEYRQQLQNRAMALQAARLALNRFNEANPTEADLKKREQELLLAQHRQGQRDIRGRMRENVCARLELLTQLEKLETGPADIINEARRKFPQRISDELPFAAGLDQKLQCFVRHDASATMQEWNFFEGKGAPTSRWVAVKYFADSWLKRAAELDAVTEKGELN